MYIIDILVLPQVMKQVFFVLALHKLKSEKLVLQKDVKELEVFT